MRTCVAGIGYDSFVDDLSSVDSKGLSDKTCEVLVRINKQSPDIAGGVHVGKDDMDVGAGDGLCSSSVAVALPWFANMVVSLLHQLQRSEMSLFGKVAFYVFRFLTCCLMTWFCRKDRWHSAIYVAEHVLLHMYLSIR